MRETSTSTCFACSTDGKRSPRKWNELGHVSVHQRLRTRAFLVELISQRRSLLIDRITESSTPIHRIDDEKFLTGGGTVCRAARIEHRRTQ
jgi:hypothetical protein